MPYVNDAKTKSFYKRAFCQFVASYPPSMYFDTMWMDDLFTASQYGWRSRGETKAARESLSQVQDNAKWNDTRRVIEAMDRVERALTNPLIRSQSGWDVHERTYSVTEQTNMVAPTMGLSGSFGPPSYLFTPSFALTFSPSTPVRTDSFMRTEGGKLLRSSRPTLPHASLAQWVGELRSLKSIVRPANLKGSDKEFLKGFGSSYLAWQFGVAPFVGDIFKAAEAVLDSKAILDKFLLDSNKIVRRQHKLLLTQNALTITGANNGSTANFGQNPWPVNISTGYGDLGVTFRKAIGIDAVRSTFKVTMNVEERLRSFASFEYFAYDPDGFLEKMAFYEQQARILLDASPGPDVIWKLTPWTWLSDWFFDIGGFLSYQVSVQEDSLACRQSGTVYERNYEFLMHPNVYYTSGTVAFTSKTPVAWNPGLSMRYQRRLAGTPYDMGVDWSGFSTKRWFILGALGLTTGPGLKWH